jgi:hypothetical protein
VCCQCYLYNSQHLQSALRTTLSDTLSVVFQYAFK